MKKVILSISRVWINSCHSGRNIISSASHFPSLHFSPHVLRARLEQPSSRAREKGEAKPLADLGFFQSSLARRVLFFLLSLWLGKVGRERIQLQARHVPAAVGSRADGINSEEGVPRSENWVFERDHSGEREGKGKGGQDWVPLAMNSRVLMSLWSIISQVIVKSQTTHFIHVYPKILLVLSTNIQFKLWELQDVPWRIPSVLTTSRLSLQASLPIYIHFKWHDFGVHLA